MVIPYLRRPVWWPSVVTYLAVKLIARAGGAHKQRSGRMATWNRDQTGRDRLAAAVPEGAGAVTWQHQQTEPSRGSSR